MNVARRYAPNPARRTEIHRQIEARCGLSESAAMLLVELDLFNEVVLVSDDHIAAFVELKARGLADLASEPHACMHAIPTPYVRKVMDSIRNIAALEGELARRAQPREPEPIAPKVDRGADVPLSPELERAIVEDALAVVERAAFLPEASKVRIYLRSGPRYVRVFWTYRGRSDDDGGSILHFVEKATGKVYSAKSARQVGRFTGRVLPGFGGDDDA